MAEASFPLLNPSEPKGPQVVGRQSSSAGFLFPYKVGSGTLRGTQGVGQGPQIDSANNRILLNQANTNAQVAVGQLNPSVASDQSFGLSITDVDGNKLTIGIGTDGRLAVTFTDSSGFVVSKMTANTDYVYDKINNVNVMQSKKLPDGTYGWAVAATGQEVGGGFS